MMRLSHIYMRATISKGCADGHTGRPILQRILRPRRCHRGQEGQIGHPVHVPRRNEHLQVCKSHTVSMDLHQSVLGTDLRARLGQSDGQVRRPLGNEAPSIETATNPLMELSGRESLLDAHLAPSTLILCLNWFQLCRPIPRYACIDCPSLSTLRPPPKVNTVDGRPAVVVEKFIRNFSGVGPGSVPSIPYSFRQSPTFAHE